MDHTQPGSSKGKQPTEGRLTKEIESVTAKVPSMGYLGLAIGSMALSGVLALFGKNKTLANFVGLWVPTLMIAGLYNKLVKLEGHDFQTSPLHH